MTVFDLGGSGGNAFPFNAIGDQVTGTVVSMEEQQQTDMDGGTPSVWPDGSPKMMFKVTLQTQLRDPEDPSDDGQRSVFLRGSRKAGAQSSLSAVLDAVKAATGGSGLATGGTLGLQYIGDGQAKQRGHNPPKLYRAHYVAPTMDLSAPENRPVAPPRTEAPAGAWPAPAPPFAQQTAQQGPPPAWAQPQAQQAPPQSPPAWSQPQAQQAPPQQFQAPPAAAPTPGQPTPQQVAALTAAGMDIGALFPAYQA